MHIEIIDTVYGSETMTLPSSCTVSFRVTVYHDCYLPKIWMGLSPLLLFFPVITAVDERGKIVSCSLASGFFAGGGVWPKNGSLTEDIREII